MKSSSSAFYTRGLGHAFDVIAAAGIRVRVGRFAESGIGRREEHGDRGSAMGSCLAAIPRGWNRVRLVALVAVSCMASGSRSSFRSLPTTFCQVVRSESRCPVAPLESS